MTTFLVGVAVSIVTSVLVNEFCDISPWLAQKLIKYAARTWAGTDRDLATAYEEEWSSVIADAPGKVTKLIHAVRFALGAVGREQGRRLAQLAEQARASNSAFVTRYVEAVRLLMISFQLVQSWLVAVVASFRTRHDSSPFFRLAGRFSHTYWCRGLDGKRHLPTPLKLRGSRGAHVRHIGPCGVCDETAVVFTTPTKRARIERPPAR